METRVRVRVRACAISPWPLAFQPERALCTCLQLAATSRLFAVLDSGAVLIAFLPRLSKRLPPRPVSQYCAHLLVPGGSSALLPTLSSRPQTTHPARSRCFGLQYLDRDAAAPPAPDFSQEFHSPAPDWETEVLSSQREWGRRKPHVSPASRLQSQLSKLITCSLLPPYAHFHSREEGKEKEKDRDREKRTGRDTKRKRGLSMTGIPSSRGSVTREPWQRASTPTLSPTPTPSALWSPWCSDEVRRPRSLYLFPNLAVHTQIAYSKLEAFAERHCNQELSLETSN